MGIGSDRSRKAMEMTIVGWVIIAMVVLAILIIFSGQAFAWVHSLIEMIFGG